MSDRHKEFHQDAYQIGHRLFPMEGAYSWDNAEVCDHDSAAIPAEFALCKQMSKAWANFAGTGNPNQDGLPNWPPYTADSRATMFFDMPCRVRHNPEGRGLKIITQS